MQFSIGGADGLASLARDLKRADAALVPVLRRELRAAVKPVADKVRATAGAVSDKVARTVGTQVTTARRRSATVAIVARSSKMPAGHEPLPRLLEHGGEPGMFRHPVFGSDVWVNQQAHPFMAPVALREMPQVEARVEVVLDAMTRIITGR